MDQRIEAFLADVMALEGETPDAIREAVRAGLADCEAVFRAEGETPDAIREAVRAGLADCEAVFRAQEANRHMKEKAGHACHSLCRGRLAEEIRLRTGTPTAEHLRLVLSIIDGR
jgi:hypothetical protein